MKPERTKGRHYSGSATAQDCPGLLALPSKMTSRTRTSSFIEMSGPDGPRLTRLPGLDGIRGAAVAAVVAYHVGFGWMVGGYLGVSTFFTLSGFLITSLLLNESRREGRISLGDFWGRRFRRLLPASLLTLALIATLFARLVADADQRQALRGGVLSSLFNVANWHAILNGPKYGDFTVSPSPVVHFWSLSIEEQFYVFFPLLMILLWKVAKGRRDVLGALFVGLTAVSTLLPWVFSMSTNRAYLGSDTRAAEMFIGGALAVVLSYESVRRRIVLRYRPRTGLLFFAGVSVVVQLYLWVTVEQSSPWLYRGGLLLYALMTCVIIAGAALPVGPLSAVMSTPPLRWLGTRSYGIYLFHWPLLLTARHLWPSWERPAQGGVAVAVTLVAAELSYRYVEQPVRLGRWPAKGHGLRAVRYTAVGIVAVAVLACLPLPVDKSKLSTDFEAALQDFNRRRPPVTTSEPKPEDSGSVHSTQTTVPTPPDVARIATFGDSTALLSGLGLALSNQRGSVTNLVDSGGDVALGCGVSRFATVRLQATAPPTEECLTWEPRWSGVVTQTKPDIAQLITGAWELPDAQLPGTGDWTSIGSPAADAFIESELNTAVDTLASGGALVLVYLWPAYAPWADDHGLDAIAAQQRPERMERLHALINQVAAAHPETVRVIDLSEYLGPERMADQTIRPDGLHIPAELMEKLYTEGLADKIYGVYADWWKRRNP